MPTDTPFIAWISNYGQIILFFAQILFWLAVSVAAIWSTLIFRRFAHAKLVSTPAADATPSVAAAPAAEPDSAISIEEFVD